MNMRMRLSMTATLFLLATTFCHASSLTLAEADAIIVVLIIVVFLLLILGGISLYYNKVVSRRNEQLLRILNALDNYRAIVADGALSLDKQEEMIKKTQSKLKKAKTVQTGDCQTFYVMMDSRVNKEKPFTNPDFDQQALADFMDVDLETFCALVPRYKEPSRTLDYINSLRAEYAAKMFMEQSDCSMDDIAAKCGFKETAAFVHVFKFAFGVTPSDYLHSINQMFKKKAI